MLTLSVLIFFIPAPKLCLLLWIIFVLFYSFDPFTIWKFLRVCNAFNMRQNTGVSATCMSHLTPPATETTMHKITPCFIHDSTIYIIQRKPAVGSCVFNFLSFFSAWPGFLALLVLGFLSLCCSWQTSKAKFVHFVVHCGLQRKVLSSSNF